MKTYDELQFIQWAGKIGIEPDAGYPKSAILRFKPDPKLDRFWIIPGKPELRPYFLARMLDLLGDWDSCWIWRHMGSWHKEPHDDWNSKVEFQILAGIGLPMGTAAILEFSRSEIDRLITLLFSTTAFGWSVGEDLYLVPDNAQYLIEVSHHEVIHVSFRRETDLEQYVTEMAVSGFPLPEAVPDATFKTPDWMKKD